MTDDLALTLAATTVPAVVGSLLTFAGVWLSSRRTDRKVEEVRQLAAPTDQAWAERVELALADIRADARATREDMVRHLHDHATAGRHGGWFSH